MTDEQIREVLFKATDDDSDPSLRNQVIALRAQGISKEKLLEQLEHLRAQMRIQDDELREDAIMDVMDALTGWVAPTFRIE